MKIKVIFLPQRFASLCSLFCILNNKIFSERNKGKCFFDFKCIKKIFFSSKPNFLSFICLKCYAGWNIMRTPYSSSRIVHVVGRIWKCALNSLLEKLGTDFPLFYVLRKIEKKMIEENKICFCFYSVFNLFKFWNKHIKCHIENK